MAVAPYKMFLILLVSIGLGKVSASDENTVHISQGDVHGLSATSRGGRPYHAFKGIPFGKVERRFGISKPADKWDGVFNAHDSGPGCVKFGFFVRTVTGREDCLTLDVYTPRLPANSTTTKLPVMVWIYGGGFVAGSSSEYDGSYFMDSDIVLVVINYRLGVLGFLNAGVESARGNQGLKDQVLALRWVQQNIAYFSGDKDKVTIFGESAGSISVSLHTLSPMSKGLFHRAIMQSGPAFLPFFYHGADGPSLAKKLGREMDCPTSNMEYLVQCLERLDPKVYGPFMNLLDELGWDESSIFMGPSYETFLHDESQIFLSEDPYKIALEGKINKVPMIMGLVAFESYATAISVTNSPELVKKLKAQYGRVAPNMLFFANSAEDPAQVANAIKKYFIPGGQDICSKTVMEFENLLSERHWIHPFRTLASLYSKHVPVYLFNFTQHVQILTNVSAEAAPYLPKHEEGQTRRLPLHGDELPYLFDIQDELGTMFEPITNDSSDYEFSQSFISTWVSFAKNGKPDGPWVEWATFDKQKIMHIQDPPKLMPIPESWENNTKFWNSLYIKEYGQRWSSESGSAGPGSGGQSGPNQHSHSDL